MRFNRDLGSGLHLWILKYNSILILGIGIMSAVVLS